MVIFTFSFVLTVYSVSLIMKLREADIILDYYNQARFQGLDSDFLFLLLHKQIFYNLVNRLVCPRDRCERCCVYVCSTTCVTVLFFSLNVYDRPRASTSRNERDTRNNVQRGADLFNKFIAMISQSTTTSQKLQQLFRLDNNRVESSYGRINDQDYSYSGGRRPRGFIREWRASGEYRSEPTYRVRR